MGISPFGLLQQKYHNRNLFLTVLEAGKFNIKSLVDLVSGEGLLPGL